MMVDLIRLLVLPSLLGCSPNPGMFEVNISRSNVQYRLMKLHGVGVIARQKLGSLIGDVRLAW